MEKGINIEISDLDLRYESYRIREKKVEQGLLISIAEKGILDPLRGAGTQEEKILLDGFKRLRCARKLDLKIIPYISIGTNEAEGILELIRGSESRSLNIFEQVKLIEILKKEWGLAIPEIAREINKSTGWVGMRVTVLQEITPNVIDKIMRGNFSAYAYMYFVKPFMRMKGVTKEDVNRFVNALSDKKNTTREVKQLANLYFTGSKKIKEQIEKGNPHWVQKRLESDKSSERIKYSPSEQQILYHLELVRKGMRQLANLGDDIPSQTPAFLVQVNLTTEGILKWMESFSKKMVKFYDQSRQAHGNPSTPPAGNEQTGDLQATEGQ